MKSRNTKIFKRTELFEKGYLGKHCYNSAQAFLKIRLPAEEKNRDQQIGYDILDQTRIHRENYKLASKIASDLIFEDKT